MFKKIIISPKQALVVKLGHIGDVLVTTPIFTALKQNYPDIKITALVNEGTEVILKENPFIDYLLILKRHYSNKFEATRHQFILLHYLIANHFDLALELSGGDRGAFLVWASGAQFRIGFAPPKRHLRAHAFHLLVNARGTTNHVVETLLRQVRSLGIEPLDTKLKLFPSLEDKKRAQTLLAKYKVPKKKFALIHPTSRWMFKTWTPEGNAFVAKYLLKKGIAVILSAAPTRHEQNFITQTINSLGNNSGIINLSGQINLSILGALLEQALLFFGVDSAPMHMAAALKVPSVVLFGPSGEKMWGPWQVTNEIVTLAEPCRPCGRDGCHGKKVSRCLINISPNLVIQALDRLLTRIA